MTLNLTDAECTALRQLLTEAVHQTKYALAPRPRQFTSILQKLGGAADRLNGRRLGSAPRRLDCKGAVKNIRRSYRRS